MNRYLKLVNFEFNRFLKIYLVLIGLTIVSQMAGVFITSRNYLNTANEMMHQEGMSLSQFLEQFGEMSFYDISVSLWFLAPIAISIVTLMLYVFLIWYRDWFAKNTFIYRLLTLPTARLNIYLSKATVIFLMVLGLIALQIVLLPVENTVFKWMVSLDLRLDITFREMFLQLPALVTLIPNTLPGFIKDYLTGFMAVFVLFTIILFERSWRFKGIIAGVLFGACALMIVALPAIFQVFILPNYFYPNEMYILEILTVLIVSACAIGISHALLNKQITV